MKMTLLLAFLLVGVMLFASQQDVPLSPEAKTLVDRLDDRGDSEAYLFLSGLDVHADDNPADVGKALLEESRLHRGRDGLEVTSYDDTRKIPLPSGDLFCPAWEDGCLERLFSQSFDVENLHHEHKVLMERLAVFHEFGEYQTLTQPNLSEVYPPYRYVAAAERIRVLAAISAYKSGDASTAIDSLTKQLAEIRNSLTLQDSLIGKLVFLMKFAEVVDVLSIIHSQSGRRAAFIAELSSAENDFRQVIAREFGMFYYGFLTLDRHPGFLDQQDLLPGWMVRILYKPNMSINAMAPLYSEAEHLAQLTPAEFAAFLDKQDRYIPSTSKIRNYAGSALISVSPNFDQYIARFKDVDAKLRLFNQRYHHQADLTQLKNPFYPSESPDISADDACFRGPLRDIRYLRCIRI